MAKAKKNPKISEATRRARRKYNATPKAKKRRAELNKINRRKGTYGNGDGMDNSHTSKGKTVKEKASSNRKRNGRNGKSKYKKNKLVAENKTKNRGRNGKNGKSTKK